MIVGLLRVLTGTAPRAETSSGTDTEFTAEIVRIAEILPHPNADRLELARFELKGSGLSAYEVVVQRGTYRVGDLAAYFSVDCVVPTAHPDFAFLKQRLDGNGKDYFRLRAARLRGVFSQGLLVPPGDSQFGEQVAEKFGVTYYRAEPAASRAVVLADTNLDEVPLLYCGAYEPALLGMSEGLSTVRHRTNEKPHTREGVVIESVDRKKKAKFVGEGYLMRKGA